MQMLSVEAGLLAWCVLSGESGHDAGRRLLSRLWQRCRQEPMPEIAIAPRGKPYFPGNPMYFSISHTANHAFCILSSRPVGLDAEEMSRRVNPKLAEKVLSPRELSQYRSSPDPNAALLKLWVLKEAAVKATGEGLRGYPNQTDFSPEDPAVTEIDGCYVAVLTLEEP